LARSARDLAGYRLIAGLGEGGMARVYLALSKKAAGFSKLVVLKVLRSSTTEDPELRRMFFDEARIAASDP
jgi:serine/threonine protein kinase